MGVKPLPEKRSIKFIVPSETKNHEKIPQDKIDKYIRAIEGRALHLCGGSRRFLNCKGSGLAKDGETMYYEDINVIEIKGKMPLTDQELTLFAQELDQDSLYVEIDDQAYLYDQTLDGVPEHFETINKDNSMVSYYREVSQNGSVKYFFVDFNENGEVGGAGSLSESEVSSMTERADEEIFSMHEYFELQGGFGREDTQNQQAVGGKTQESHFQWVLQDSSKLHH